MRTTLRSTISFILALCMLLTSLPYSGEAFAQSKKSNTKKTSPSQSFKPERDCKEGKCVDALILKLETLEAEGYKRGCLPKGKSLTEAQLKHHFENTPVTETCWGIFIDMENTRNKLHAVKRWLESEECAQTGKCLESKRNIDVGLNGVGLEAIGAVEEKLACTPEKKKQVQNKCGSDALCAITASALTMTGPVGDLLMPSKLKKDGCKIGQDSCMVQLATAFVKSVFSFFEGIWDLLKGAGKYIGKKAKQFWNWVTDAEDATSTSQLAMAKASQEEGVFQMLRKDFGGTMKKIWTGLVEAIKQWIQNDVFCQKWSGAPHFSQCLQPSTDVACVPCKTMITGLCSAVGYIAAEIIPAFLTGGLVTAAKYGASAAGKIAKTFKVSKKLVSSVKKTRMAEEVMSKMSSAKKVISSTKIVSKSSKLLSSLLSKIGTHLARPSAKLYKSAQSALSKMMASSKVWLVETKTGRVVAFSANAVKTSAKIAIWPIENSMTVKAFKLGQKTFDKAFKVVLSKATTKGGLVVSASAKSANLISKTDDAYAAVVKASHVTEEIKPQLMVEAEKGLRQEAIQAKRGDIVSSFKKDNSVKLEQIVDELYPELQYGNLAKQLGPDEIVKAEKELLASIGKIDNETLRNQLTQDYLKHTSSRIRQKVVNLDESFLPEKVIENASLNDGERIEKSFLLLKVEDSNLDQKALRAAILKAHNVGKKTGSGIYEYTWSELRQKTEILRAAGLTDAEAELLIRSGLVGRPPVRELIKHTGIFFDEHGATLLKKDYMSRREEVIKGLSERLGEKPDDRNFLQKLLGAKKSTNEKELSQLIDNLDAVYFIDYKHAKGDFMDIMMSQKELGGLRIFEKYEKKAFDNYKDARKMLQTKQPEMSKQTLIDVHSEMMKGGVEDVTADMMGKVRDGSWYGNVPRGHEISEDVVKVLNQNPYLTWIESSSHGGKFTGQIWYPNADKVRDVGLDLIKDSHPEVYKRIKDYQATKVGDARTLTRDLVNAMTDERIERYNKARAALGDINSPEKLEQFADIVADFQRDLVSIHPVANGNGRSTREFALYYPLMKEGFPPPRILDPNADLYTSQAEWRKVIKHGILSSDYLMEDLAERLRFGLPLENSLELITPYTRPGIVMDMKKTGSKVITNMEGVEYIDPRVYREIIKRNPEISAKLNDDPIQAWDEINKEAVEVFKKNNVYYTHQKAGLERLELGFIDDDFLKMYGRNTFVDADAYNFKMKTWYNDDITWRGLASKSQVKTEEEIIDMFQEFDSHMASNAVLGKIRGGATPDKIRAAALEDFKKYNDDVFGDGLVQMAKDHSETGPMYGISYGYSTSKNREVGKAFSMGAMVVGPYGQHKAPELQALLKSRTLVGARSARKDVDLGRLKQLRDDFSYKYGRQQEVMGIGVAEPDAITIVQTIDAEGEVMLSYLRNPEKPSEIWVIKGDIRPGETPTVDQLVKTVTLTKKGL